MPVPQTTQTETRLDDRQRLRADLEQITKARPTVVIEWTTDGLRIEGPGSNGHRQKVTDVAFSDLPAPIQAALVEQRDRLARDESALRGKMAPQATRTDPQIERYKKLETLRVDQKRKYNEWLAALTPVEREYHLRKREENLTKAAEQEAERTRQLWLMTVVNHDIPLANRVVPDPQKRPRRKVIMVSKNGGQTHVSPRSLDSQGEVTAKKKSGKKVDLSLAIDLDL